MKNSVCPACGAQVPLGTYFKQMWWRRIDCPACKKTARVAGMAVYYLIFVPIAGLVGFGGQQVWRDHGLAGLAPLLAGMAVAASVGLMAGLATWMRLEKE